MTTIRRFTNVWRVKSKQLLSRKADMTHQTDEEQENRTQWKKNIIPHLLLLLTFLIFLHNLFHTFCLKWRYTRHVAPLNNN